MDRLPPHTGRYLRLLLVGLTFLLVVAPHSRQHVTAQAPHPPLTPIPTPQEPQRSGSPTTVESASDDPDKTGNSGDDATFAATGGTWAQASPIDSPSARAQMGFVYDSTRSVIVATGGSSNVGALNQTWEYNGTTWTQRVLGSGPGGRNRPAVAYDPIRRVTVLFGGSMPDTVNFFNDTWEYNGTSWTKRTTV